jgi:hypothetical protein
MCAARVPYHSHSILFKPSSQNLNENIKAVSRLCIMMIGSNKIIIFLQVQDGAALRCARYSDKHLLDPPAVAELFVIPPSLLFSHC